MSGLYPTPSRLELLRDVDAGNVRDVIHVSMVDCGEGQLVEVAFMIQAMEREGWVEHEPAEHDVWRLTDLGRQVLEHGTP
jgi:hypothetical protein